MSYLVSTLYYLLFVAEIYASWVTLTGPEFFNQTDNLFAEDTNITTIEDSIHHEISITKTQSTQNSESTIQVPLNPGSNITVSTYEPKNEQNKSNHSSHSEDYHSQHFTESTSTTTKMGLRTTSNGIQDKFINTESIKNHAFHRDEKLLLLLNKLADKVAANTRRKEETDLIYSSYIIHVGENTTNISWKGAEINGPEVTLLAHAVHQLPTNSTIKIVMFKEKYESKYLGDIVVIKTESTETNTSGSVLEIKFEKKYLFYSEAKWKCVYWDYENSTWKDTGIQTKIEQQFVICLSNHLSAFSILLDPHNILYDMEYSNDSGHQLWLTNISIIGSWITICFLTLVIIINYRKKTESETKKILMHSTSALLLTHVSYQIYTFLDIYFSCLVVNFMTHYFVLAFLLWTASDGINMWRILFTDVFNTKGYVFYLWYKIISWGVPLITTSIGLFFTELHSQRKCELKFHRTYDLIFYLIPCMLILFCNMLLFTWMFMKMTCKSRLGRMKDKKLDYVLALTQVFGIGWCLVFPFLCFPSTHLLGEYLFVGVTSTQGLLIFVVRCGNDKNLRRKLRSGFQSTLNSSSVSTWLRKMSKSSSDHSAPTTQKSISMKLDVTRSLRSQF